MFLPTYYCINTLRIEHKTSNVANKTSNVSGSISGLNRILLGKFPSKFQGSKSWWESFPTFPSGGYAHARKILGWSYAGITHLDQRGIPVTEERVADFPRALRCARGLLMLRNTRESSTSTSRWPDLYTEYSHQHVFIPNPHPSRQHYSQPRSILCQELTGKISFRT